MKHITPFGIFATIMVAITITFIAIVVKNSDKEINLPEINLPEISFNKYSNLYDLTDQAIHEVCMSTSIFDLPPQKFTEDGNYQIIPIGRMVAVKILSEGHTYNDYESLMKNLKKHYKDNSVIHGIYINNGGTITIDCRY